MRIFVPATIAVLQTLVEDREISPVSRTAFGVTPALREAYSSGDDDELAEVAMNEAARASLRLLATEVSDAEGGPDAEGGSDATGPDGVPTVRYRRAVIAADVENVTLRPDLDDAVVRLPQLLTMANVAAVHVDLAEAEPAVRAAVEVVDAADLGDPDAEFVVGDAEDHQLAWYAPQELPFLLELL